MQTRQVEPSSTESQALDAAISRQVKSYTREDEDYWSFRGSPARQHSHGYFQYPAMMVPEMISDLIRSIIEVKPKTKSIVDPFAGSGTVLTEAMLQGRDFLARDVNPLAVLLCKVKQGPFFPEATKIKGEELLDRISNDRKHRIEASFTTRTKWFAEDVAVELSKIRRAIESEPAPWARRFFWIVLAETVRTTSNSRTSTFKLHIRSEEERKTRKVSPIATFKSVLKENLESLDVLTQELQEQEHLTRGYYDGVVEVQHHDARIQRATGTLYDLLVTSPPYGDNTTTVPYGQHAFLPLQWIELSDIDPKISSECIKTTHEIDFRSLGGSRRDAIKKTVELKEISPAFAATLSALADEPSDRSTRVAAFVRDLSATLSPVLSLLRRNAYLIWTVGNRQVAKRPVPLDAILTELLKDKKVVPIARFTRDIPTKRMAVKNSITDTMGAETILVFRKDAE